MSASVDAADMQHSKLGHAVFAVGVGNSRGRFDFAHRPLAVAILADFGVFAVGISMRSIVGIIRSCSGSAVSIVLLRAFHSRKPGESRCSRRQTTRSQTEPLNDQARPVPTGRRRPHVEPLQSHP